MNKLNLKQAKANTRSESTVRGEDNKQRNYKSAIVGGPRGRNNFEDGQDGIFRIIP